MSCADVPVWVVVLRIIAGIVVGVLLWAPFVIEAFRPRRGMKWYD